MKTNRIGKPFIIVGLLLIAAALCLTVGNLRDEMRAADASAEALQRLIAELDGIGGRSSDIQQLPDYIIDPEIEMPTVEADGESYIGILDIPALELSLPVIGEWSRPSLKLAPCRYRGSPYGGDLIITAYNYRCHFGSLSRLKLGDRVYFTDMAGNVFVYRVAETEFSGNDDVEAVLSGEWELSLVTCTVSGKTRMAVRCVIDYSRR